MISLSVVDQPSVAKTEIHVDHAATQQVRGRAQILHSCE